MPTKRRRIGPRHTRHAAAMPAGARWWLEHGQSLSIGEAEALGMTAKDAWLVSNLHFARSIVTGWSRADLRQLGFGPMIDQHIARGACPHDDWRTSAQVIELPLAMTRNQAQPERA